MHNILIYPIYASITYNEYVSYKEHFVLYNHEIIQYPFMH